MEIGIVGLPNVGKSTLFNALTGAEAAVANFPFTTIESNIGVVPLSDARLSRLAQEYGSSKITPAGIRFVDIAGLVKGASKGEGLGNKFLANIRGVDAIAHVVRFFHDENVVNVLGEADPLSSVEIIETELLLADLEQCQRALEKLQGPARSGDKRAMDKVMSLEVLAKGFNEGKSARDQEIDRVPIEEFQFLTAKPVMYVANVVEDEASCPPLEPLKEYAKKKNANVIVLCAKLEAEIVQLSPEERTLYYESAGITSPGLTRFSEAGKELLGLICFFTANQNETRAWFVPQGTKAVKAAGKIHSDMERGFIRAEVYRFEDLMKLGTYKAIQEKGLLRSEGKEYEVQEGDVVYFRFNV